MNDQTININDSGSGEKISVEQYGKESASDSKADPATLESSLVTVYNKFLSDQKLDADGIRQRITRLESEILQKKNAKENFKSEIISLEQQKESREKRVEELEIDRIKLKEEGAPGGDLIPFVIGLFIVILLTFFLFVFYSSTVYSAIAGIKKGTFGLINPNVFADAQSKGGGDLAFIILAPVFFLAIGFLLHDALDKSKYWLISGLLVLTFSVDAILGYKISQNLHSNDFNAGLTNEQWKFRMIFYDVNFYLVLMFGFVAYVIWGLLLHYTLNKYKDLQPDRALELRLDNLDIKIDEQRGYLSETISNINNLKGQVASIDNDIEQKQKYIIGYKNGDIPIDIPRLSAIVGQFMQGWFTYINFMFSTDTTKIKDLTEQSASIQKAWLENKINSLETGS